MPRLAADLILQWDSGTRVWPLPLIPYPQTPFFPILVTETWSPPPVELSAGFPIQYLDSEYLQFCGGRLKGSQSKLGMIF